MATTRTRPPSRSSGRLDLLPALVAAVAEGAAGGAAPSETAGGAVHGAWAVGSPAGGVDQAGGAPGGTELATGATGSAGDTPTAKAEPHAGQNFCSAAVRGVPQVGQKPNPVVITSPPFDSTRTCRKCLRYPPT